MIDLHVHSTFSDGSLTPAQLVQQAVESGLHAVALTDHDTTDGLAPFLAAASTTAVRAVPGVEISVDVQHGTLHLLGYFIQPGTPTLDELLTRIRHGREIRNQQILDKLNRLGFRLSWDEVASFAGEDVVGRPHFALAMIAKGFVKNKDQAFGEYLGKGRRAYVDRLRFPPAESIQAIRSAGGVAVLAHPATLDLQGTPLRTFIESLSQAGLGGMEVYYSEHSPDQFHSYLNLARELGLAITGGSDFHGKLNPDIRMGVGFGGLRIPDELVDALAARCG